MKRFLLSLIFLLPLVCFANPQKKKIKKMKRQQEVIVKIGFETFTRRGNIQLSITKDSAISVGRTETKFILVKPGKWNNIVASLSSVQLPAVPKWESPTKKREYDGASHCRITIYTKNNTYESQYFDGGQPMKQLKLLYDIIEKIRNDIAETGQEYSAPAG